MAQTKPVIAIVNVVASATINQKLDLLDITKKFPDVEWNPEQFPGAVFRLRNPKTATLLFGSGKMVCTCAKSIKSFFSSKFSKISPKKAKWGRLIYTPYTLYSQSNLNYVFDLN